MADMNFTVDANVSPAVRNLDKLQNRVEKLNSTFDGMRTALAGLALGSFAVSAIKFADSMQDLSNATGIAVNSIVGLSKTFQASGGDAEQARQAIIKLNLSIAEAREGSKNAQLAFKDVNVTLQDLATLSEEDILGKTIEGLARIEDPAQRLKTAVELLGKGAKGIDFTAVAAGYTSAAAEAAKYNEAIAKSAALNDKFEAAVGKLKLTFLSTFEPFADAINKLDDQKINQIIESMTKLAVAVAGLAAALKGLEIVAKVFIFMQSSLLLVSGGFAALVKTVSAFGTQIRGFMAALGAGTPILEALGVTLGVLAGKRIPWLIKSLGMLAKGFLGVVGVLYTVYEVINALTNNALSNWLSTTYDKVKAILGLGGAKTDAGGMSPEEVAAENQRIKNRDAAAKADEAAKKRRAEAKAYYEEQARQIEANVAAFKRQGDEIVKNLQLEVAFNGVSEDTVEIIKAQNDAYKRTADEVQKLRDQKAALKPNETELAAIIDQQIAKVQKLGQEQANQATAAIQQLQAQRDAQDRLNHALEMKSLAIKNDESLLQLQEQLGLVGKYGDALQNNLVKLDVERELRGKLNEYAIKQLELENQRAKLGEDNFNREMAQLEQLRQAAVGYANARLEAENKIVAATRKSEREDVTTAIGKRLEELQRSIDPTVLAVQKVDSIFGNMGRAIDDFVKTGKFKFKEFSLSIIQDLIAIELKAQATKILSSVLGSAGSFLGSLFGFANGGNPPVNKPSIVGERGPELFVPKTAGTVVPNEMLGMGSGPVNNTYITNNISAIDAKSVAQLFAENRKTLLGSVKMAEKELPYRLA
jgi:lambda family phage tail tape measure protein